MAQGTAYTLRPEWDGDKGCLNAGLLLCRGLGIGDLWWAERGVTSSELRTPEEIGWKLNVVADACNPALRRLQQEDLYEFKASLD